MVLAVFFCKIEFPHEIFLLASLIIWKIEAVILGYNNSPNNLMSLGYFLAYFFNNPNLLYERLSLIIMQINSICFFK